MRRANWRKVKTHLTYTYDEAARTLGVHKRSVMGWAQNGLPVFTDQRPHLIRGDDLRSFLRRKTESRKTPLKLTEFYCLKCRAARAPAGEMADCQAGETGPAMLQALCPVCMGTMFKRVARNRIGDLRAKLDVTFRRGDGTL